MNGRQFAQLGLGLLGVWALLDAINIVAGVFGAIASGAGRPAGSIILVVGGPTFVLLGLSYVLVFHNASLATAIAPSVDAMDDHAGAGLPRLLVSLLGAMIALESLPRLVNLILNIFVAAGDPDIISGGALRRGLIGAGVQFACALYLVFRPERFLGFLNRPRVDVHEAVDAVP